MEVSGQLNAPAALSPEGGGGGDPWYPLVEGWVGPTAGLGRRDKHLALAGNRTTIFRTPSQ